MDNLRSGRYKWLKLNFKQKFLEKNNEPSVTFVTGWDALYIVQIKFTESNIIYMKKKLPPFDSFLRLFLQLSQYRSIAIFIAAHIIFENPTYYFPPP